MKQMQRPENDPKTTELFSELLESLSGLLTAELHLAQVRFFHRLGITGNQILFALSILCLALLGSGAIMASIILALGKALDERYWLSSLIVAAGLLLIGLPANIFYFRMKRQKC